MRIIYPLSLTVLCASLLTVSCVNKDYDLKNLENVNTDINFGGEYFGLPLGNFNPITLKDFLKPGDMLSVVDGRYEFRYADSYEAEVGQTESTDISVDVPSFDDTALDFSNVSISSMQMPKIDIAGSGKVNLPDNVAGRPSVEIPTLTLPVNGTAPVKILYEYTGEIKQINHINIGASSTGKGELIRMVVSPSYNDVLAAAQIKIDSFEITFPVGFELGVSSTDPYGGQLSTDKRTYSISGKMLNTANPIRFYVSKLTFNPATDQKDGELSYINDIEYKATFHINGTTAANISKDEISIAMDVDQLLSMSDGDFDINKIVSEVQPEKIDIAVNQALGSDLIKSLSKIYLTEKAPLTIHIAENGLPEQIAGMQMKDYKVVFPSFLDFEDAELNKTKTLIINDQIKRGAGLTKTVYITGFSFTENPVQPDGNINLSGMITTSGQGVEVPSTNNIQSSDIQNIVISPTVTLAEMKVGRIEGKVKPELDVEPQVVDFSFDDDMSFLYESNLDLDRIALRMNVKNTTDITANLGIELTPYNADGSPITENKVSQLTGIEIKPSSTSKLWLSNSQKGMPEGYIFVENQNINRLLHRMPSKMQADMAVTLDSKSVTIDLNNPDAMKMNIDYEVVAPLSPGEDFKLVYSYNIDGLNKSLKDFLGYISDIKMALQATNEIPLDLSLSAQAFDTNGSNVGVAITVEGMIKAGGKDSAATKSDIILSITEEREGELAKLDKIKLTLIGSGNEQFAGTDLEEDQTLKLSGKVFIPGGINITDNK